VATILKEKKVPYELIEVKVTEGEHKSPKYLKKQPFGQVPYIVCDSFNPSQCGPYIFCIST
jgi:glutathione S-transferase